MLEGSTHASFPSLRTPVSHVRQLIYSTTEGYVNAGALCIFSLDAKCIEYYIRAKSNEVPATCCELNLLKLYKEGPFLRYTAKNMYE